MRRTTYLSGTIGGLTYEQATKDRNRATELLLAADWDILDPMRGYDILSTLEVIEEGDGAKTLLGVTDQAICQRDRDDIRRCDVLLVLTGDIPTFGTCYETEFAYGLGKPIVMVASTTAAARHHPWCRSMVSYFAETVDEAIDFIIRWYDRDYKLDSCTCKHTGRMGRVNTCPQHATLIIGA